MSYCLRGCYIKLQLGIRSLNIKTENEFNTYDYYEGIGITEELFGRLNQNQTMLHVPLVFKMNFGKRIKLSPLIGIYYRERGYSNAFRGYTQYTYGRWDNQNWIPFENNAVQIRKGAFSSSLYRKKDDNFGGIIGFDLQWSTTKKIDPLFVFRYQRGFKDEISEPFNIKQEFLLLELGIIYKGKREEGRGKRRK